MSDRTIVTPSEVRGWGNVIGERSTSDFGLYDAVLTSTSATVDSRSRTVFTLGVLTNGTVCTLSAVSSSISVGDTPSLTGYLKDNENTGLSGKSVKIYQGTTLLTTVTTGSGGAFSYTGSATTGAGSLTFHAIFSGDGDYGGSTSSDVSITVSKVNTSLAIDVPLVLVYSDEFNITGTLKDASNNVLNGKTVDLYVGNTKVNSGTTNSSGIVQFTRTPVSMGTHSFQLKFDGDNKYNNVSSETVTRSIGKETAVLSLTSPVNNSSVYTGSSVSVAGSLTDNDGVAMPSKTIVVSESGNQITTFTTNNNGSFSGSLTGLSTASHSLKFEFVADDYFTGSSVTRSVTVADHTYSLTASASSTSIVEGQSVTISGVLTKDGVGWANQSVIVYANGTAPAYNESVTVTTGSDGSYSATFSSLSSAGSPYTIYATDYDNVDSDDVTVYVSANAPASLSVTGTKSILSYADSESSVLTATVLDSGGNALSGQTVVFKKGSTTLDTKTTDSNGQCSYTYASAGVGDVTITVECSLLQETFVVYDCLFGDDMTVANSKYTITGSMSTNEHSSNGWKYGNGSGLVWIDLSNFAITQAVSVEYTPTEINDRSASLTPIMIYFENSSQTRVYFTQATTFVQLNSSTKTNHNASLNSQYRLEYTSNTLKLYLGDTLISSVNHSLGTSNIKVRLATGGERYCRLKNFKIKAL